MMDDMEKTLIETVQRSKSNTHRIDELEEKTEAIQDLAIGVKELAFNMGSMAEEQKKQGERLTALEKQPAEHWNTLTKTILTAVVSTLCGGLVGALLALFAR